MSERVVKIKPRPECRACRGRGIVYDAVPMPFGPGSCSMPSICDCVTDQLSDEDADDSNVEIKVDDSEYAARLADGVRPGGVPTVYEQNADLCEGAGDDER